MMHWLTSAVTTAVTSDVITEAVNGAGGGASSFNELLYKGWLGLLHEKGSFPLPFYVIAIVLCALMGYLLGSINFAVVISKVKYHDDIRKHGSGNAGATNMSRTYGKGAGIATLLGDLLKAIVSVLIARFLLGEVVAYLTGMCCVIGHAFPCYYHFKGGKGVAVTAAMALALEPLVFLILFGIFAIMVGFTKYVSLGSIFTALMYPVILHTFVMNRQRGYLSILFVVVIALLVLWLHRENMKRLLEGKENKFSFKKGKKEGENVEK